MKNILGFQLYLLGQMRGEGIVDKALAMLNASRADCEAAKELMVDLGFESLSPPPTADLFYEILGSARIGEADVETLPLKDSTPLRFRLPLWPQFDFVVQKQISDYAFMTGFQRSRDELELPPLHSALDLNPWNFVEQEVAKSFCCVQELDHWPPLKDLL